MNIDESRKQYSGGYYAEKLEIGLQFQDYITTKLYQRGIVLNNFVSKKNQISCGENMLGVEIKKDMLFRDTGNLYFEVSEKSHPDKTSYAASGIHRKDNSWLFIIGDEKTIYIFPINYLVKLSGRYRKVQTPTSKAFLMPIADAEKYCIRKFEFE